MEISIQENNAFEMLKEMMLSHNKSFFLRTNLFKKSCNEIGIQLNNLNGFDSMSNVMNKLVKFVQEYDHDHFYENLREIECNWNGIGNNVWQA